MFNVLNSFFSISLFCVCEIEWNMHVFVRQVDSAHCFNGIDGQVWFGHRCVLCAVHYVLSFGICPIVSSLNSVLLFIVISKQRNWACGPGHSFQCVLLLHFRCRYIKSRKYIISLKIFHFFWFLRLVVFSILSSSPISVRLIHLKIIFLRR